jgi:death on curing protein
MILINSVLELHDKSIKLYGGSNGIRNNDLLESAIARPFATFDGVDLYKTPFEKAAALGESLIINHPFVDGNKRTGFLAMTSLLKALGFFVNASQEDAYNFVIEISTGGIGIEEITEWLIKNSEAI